MAGEYESRNLTEQALHAAQEVFFCAGILFCVRPTGFLSGGLRLMDSRQMANLFPTGGNV